MVVPMVPPMEIRTVRNTGSADGSGDGSGNGNTDGSSNGNTDGSSNGSTNGSSDGSTDGSTDGGGSMGESAVCITDLFNIYGKVTVMMASFVCLIHLTASWGGAVPVVGCLMRTLS